LRYVPADALDGAPHVVVDGAPRPGTVCTLSHWPGTPTSRRLWADTSAEIVLRARRRLRTLLREAEFATVDHYDADGVIALALLVDDDVAHAHAPALVAAAHVGDFDVVRRRTDALVAFALGAIGEGRSLSEAAQAALELLPRLVAAPERFEEWWGPEAEAFDAACALRDRGALTIEEFPDLDLAVVRVDEDAPELARASWDGAPVHPAAVHSATTCLRVATVVGRCFVLRYRYESWVRFTSRPVRPRVDLTELACVLEDAETDGGAWVFEGTGAITPALRRADDGPSTVEPEALVAEVRAAFTGVPLSDDGAGALRRRRTGQTGRGGWKGRRSGGPTAGTTG
jgi:hypothetical protein